MLRRLPSLLGKRPSLNQAPADFLRANKRRIDLERRRVRDSAAFVPPVEPTADAARSLYRKMLREGRRTLVCTDKEYYRQKLRYEFEVTARQTSARVRGIMFEKGEWMLKNNLGGII